MPADALEQGGWERTDESVETVFRLPTIRVRGASVRYEDERSRRALEAASDELDSPVRFFAGTRLAFVPPLPPGTTVSMVAPTLESEARRRFAKTLDERGLADVERDGTQRIRVGNRRQARLTKYRAVDPGLRSLALSCWIAVWTANRHATVVTSGHPATELAAHFDLPSEGPLARSPESYRDEFFSLLRAVE